MIKPCFMRLFVDLGPCSRYLLAMKIELRCFATLHRFLPENSKQWEIPDGWKISDIVAHLNVPEDELKLVFINGLHAEIDAVVKDGDRVGLFPPVGGG